MSNYSRQREAIELRRRQAARRSSSGNGCMVVIGLFVILFVLVMAGIGIFGAFHVETHEACVVDSKDRTSKQGGGSDMRVYTENCGNFTVDDSLLSMTWSSSDTYAAIEEGETYDFKTRGFRIPFLSSFPNIVEATPSN